MGRHRCLVFAMRCLQVLYWIAFVLRAKGEQSSWKIRKKTIDCCLSCHQQRTYDFRKCFCSFDLHARVGKRSLDCRIILLHVSRYLWGELSSLLILWDFCISGWFYGVVDMMRKWAFSLVSPFVKCCRYQSVFYVKILIPTEVLNWDIVILRNWMWWMWWNDHDGKALLCGSSDGSWLSVLKRLRDSERKPNCCGRYSSEKANSLRILNPTKN